MGRPLEAMPRIAWRPEYAQNPFPHLVRGYQELGPIFGLDIPDANPGMVFLIGPEANRLVYTDVDTFVKGPISKPLVEAWGPSLVSMDGPEHRFFRSLMQPTVVGPALERNLVAMSEIIVEHVEQWGAASRVDVYASARELTFAIAARLFCGMEDVTDLGRFRSLYQRVMGESSNPLVSANYDFDIDAAAEIRALIRPIVAAAKGRPGDDSLHVLANASGPTGQPLDDQIVVAQIFTLLLAGHDTTTALTSWLLWLLAVHPDVSTELEREIALLPEPDTVQTLRGCDLMNRVLLEVERLYPPLPIVGRMVTRPVTFGGFDIPAGIVVQISAAASHRLPNVFPDPDRFDPDRFLDTAEHRRPRFSLIGFGAGPRVCLGVAFAKIEVAAIVAQVLRRYRLSTDLTLPPPQELRTTAFPSQPLYVDLTSRTAVST